MGATELIDGRVELLVEEVKDSARLASGLLSEVILTLEANPADSFGLRCRMCEIKQIAAKLFDSSAKLEELHSLRWAVASGEE